MLAVFISIETFEDWEWVTGRNAGRCATWKLDRKTLRIVQIFSNAFNPSTALTVSG